MLRNQVFIAFLMGAVVALGAALVVTSNRAGLPEATAQSGSGAAGDYIVTIGQGNAQRGQDTVFVYDTKAHRLAAYSFNNNTINLVGVRNTEYDLKFQEWNAGAKANPSVDVVRDKTREEDNPKKKP
jgi:hypothetical protein